MSINKNVYASMLSDGAGLSKDRRKELGDAQLKSLLAKKIDTTLQQKNLTYDDALERTVLNPQAKAEMEARVARQKEINGISEAEAGKQINAYLGLNENVNAVPASPQGVSQDTAISPYDSYYTQAQSALRQAYDAALQNAGAAKDRTISAAYQEYLRKTQSYGVEAENLAAAGLSTGGGYGQLANSNRFNAYANQKAYANTAYQNALTDISLAETSDNADLAYQKYASGLAQKESDYTKAQELQANKQAAITSAYSYLAENWNGKTNKKNNMESLVQFVKMYQPTLSDEEITQIINTIQGK